MLSIVKSPKCLLLKLNPHFHTASKMMANSQPKFDGPSSTFFCGYSDNSVKDSINSFYVMFPDRKIASKMELGKDKLKYVVNYGIAPFFVEELKKQVDESDWLAVSYDESLNKVTQESEMDLVLRFWDT